MSWNDAQEFLERLTERERAAGKLPAGRVYRLPSEAEWEYVARAGTMGLRYGKLGTIAWYDANSRSTTHQVGKKPGNTWGLRDMLGNVWEWCEDPWHGNYQGAPGDGSVWSTEGRASRVLRGGSWGYQAGGERAARRSRRGATLRIKHCGFRVVVLSGDTVPGEPSAL